MLDRMRRDTDGEPLVDTALVADQFGITADALRKWRERHPDVLPVVARGPHGVALYRWADVLTASRLTGRHRSVTTEASR